MAFWVLLAIIIALQVIAYALTPKPKQPKPEHAKEADSPTSEAGKEIPVIFGTVTIKSANALDFCDRSITTLQVTA